MYEVRAAMRYSYYANKDLWEANRLIDNITQMIPPVSLK